MKFILLFFVSFFYSTSYCATLPQTGIEFCQRFEDKNSRPYLEFAQDPTNLISFQNNGGLFNGGVCWWHSRFQRNIFYLSIFRPDLPRPSLPQIKEIITRLRFGIEIIHIPGFRNAEEFTSTLRPYIQNELNRWQLYDGIILSKWIDGLKGRTKVSSDELKTKMETLYRYVHEEGRVAYQKLQIKGITAHAWLIIDIAKTTSGYDIGFVDSNSPNQLSIYRYQFGDQSFYTKSYGHFVPYLEFVREEQRLQKISKAFCQEELTSKEASSNYDSDYALDLIDAKNNAI